MICPRSLVLNGTFREFSDGFEELGIPRTGSAPPPSFSPLRFPLSFCLSQSGLRADSIKRLFVVAKRRVKRFVRDASRYLFFLSLFLVILSFPCIHRFLLHLPFSPFLFATRRYRCRLRFISANESFRDAPAVHPRMRTIWRIRMRRRESCR